MVRSIRVRWLGVMVAAAVVAGVVASLALAGPKAANQAPTTLKIGYVTTPGHPYGLTLAQFKRIVEERSNGQLKIQLLPVYAGGDDIALLNDIKGNVVNGGAVSAAVWPTARISSFIALQMPFLIDSYQLEQRVINNTSGIARRMLKAGTDRAGLVGLAIFEGGMRQIVAKKPITSLADLRGLKLRSVQSPILQDGMRALGISATPLPVGDVFNAIRSGAVDGAEGNSALVATFQWDRAGANHITVANLWPFPAVVVVNKTSFSALPANLQAVLRSAAADLPAFSLDTLKDTGLFPARLCARGTKYHVLPGQARKAFFLAERKVYAKYTKDRQTRAFVTAIQKLKAKIRKSATDTPPASCLE